MDNYFEFANKIEKALCNHKDMEGQPDHLRGMPDGQVYCTKCGRSFKPINMDDSSISSKIEAVCKDIIDVIETMKLLDPNLDKEYKLMIPLLEDLPSKFASIAEKEQTDTANVAAKMLVMDNLMGVLKDKQ